METGPVILRLETVEFFPWEILLQPSWKQFTDESAEGRHFMFTFMNGGGKNQNETEKNHVLV